MFHPKELLNKDYIRKVWQAANELPTGTVQECDLPEICRDMDTLITSESQDVRHKLSLRTSATLINGAARLYKTAGDNILDDVMSLHMNISQRKRNLSNGESSTKPPRMRNKTKCSTKHQHKKSPGRHSINTRNRSQDTRVNKYPTDIMNQHEIQKNSTLTSITPSIENDNRRCTDSSAEPNIDKNLPYGCLMIYKDYNSRLPSCFVFSSLKNDLRKVLKKHNML